MKETFDKLDADHDGSLTAAEVTEGILALPGIDKFTIENEKLTAEKVKRIYAFMDTDGGGQVSYMEFVAAFTLSTSGQSNVAGALMQNIASSLFRYRSVVHSACNALDDGGNLS